MRSFKNILLLSVIVLSVAALPACKTKKAVAAAAPAPVKPTPPPTAPANKPEPAAPASPPPAPAPPDYNFSNIQFEFNSGILKTDAYPLLDKAVMEMKKDPSAKFVLNGHSSAEGSEAHNMSLSVERANSVKVYLTNSGINGNNLTVKGFGESKPITSNTDEASRALNRRVEIKKLD